MPSARENFYTQLAFCSYVQDILEQHDLRVLVTFLYVLILSDSHMSLDMFVTKVSEEINIDLTNTLAQFKTTDEYISLVHKYSSDQFNTIIYPRMKANLPPNIVNIYVFCNYMRLSNVDDNITFYMYNKAVGCNSSIELDDFIIEIENHFNIGLMDYSRQYKDFKELNQRMDPAMAQKLKDKYIIKSLSTLCADANEFVPKPFTPAIQLTPAQELYMKVSQKLKDQK
jgi:hypothetical protein